MTNRKKIRRSLQAVITMLALCGVVFAHAQESVGGNVGSSDYFVGPEDVLEISVWKEESLKREVLIRPDGKLSFPLIGDIQAAGKTPDQLRREIAEWLGKYIPEPIVTVVVIKVASYNIYVLGQVKKAGRYTVGHSLNVIQALALAGGLTPYAAENNIKILRRNDGKEVAIPFEYAAINKGQKLEQNIILKSGDVVMVP